MATVGTLTVTLTDTSSMTAAEAAQIALEISETIKRRYNNDSRVTSITPTFASAAITMTIA